MAATAAVILSFTYALGMYMEGHSGPDEPPGPAPDLMFVFVIPCLNEERVIGATLDRLLGHGRDDSVDPRRRRRLRRPNGCRRRVPDGPERRPSPAAPSGGSAGQGRRAQRGRPVPRGELRAARPLRGRGRSSVCWMPTAGWTGTRRTSPAPVSPTRASAPCRSRCGSGTATPGLLPRLQDMEFVCYTELFQRCRSRAGFAGLGGNGQFTRLSALQSLGPAPWSPSTLTEDLDLGVRLVLVRMEIALQQPGGGAPARV